MVTHDLNILSPPGFPPGIDPATFRLEEVRELLESAAYFPIFSVHNPAVANRPIFSLFSPLSPVAVDVNESLHRFGIQTSNGNGFRAVNVVGDEVANVSIQWTVIPDNFEAAPDRMPPPTGLNPFRSQRFAMMNGEFRFKDQAGSGFHGFGTGRTFPVKVEGGRRLRIGAVVDILEGFGQLTGVKGTVVVNGFIEPPQGLALNMIVRLMNPSGQFRTESPLASLNPVPSPDPSATFIAFLGETDPERPVKLNTTPDGRIVGSSVNELLRLVDLDFDIRDSQEIQSRVTRGPVVGSVAAQLHFNPFAPTPVSPISTTDGVFTFFDRDRATIGTIRSNMVEGRALRTQLAGAPAPVFRFGGVGPLLGGSGRFEGVDGMMSLNAAVSVFPRTLSNLYVFRIYDPAGRFRDSCQKAWS